ncbi:YidB family protein [soil metagenome]
MGLLDNVMHDLGGDAGGGIADLLKSQGGVQGLADKFGQHGLGEIAQSWISTGGNVNITPAQIQAVIGHGPIADFAQKMGISPEQAATTLAGLLPVAVDRLTPNGNTHEAGGLLDQLPGGLGGMLGGLLKG